jgi:hypothetical protein
MGALQGRTFARSRHMSNRHPWSKPCEMTVSQTPVSPQSKVVPSMQEIRPQGTAYFYFAATDQLPAERYFSATAWIVRSFHST